MKPVNTTGDKFLSIDDEGVPHVTPQPIETPEINVCSGCGCLDLNHPDHYKMFPGKDVQEQVESV